MQTTSALYKTLLADPGHIKEIKLNIAGVEYGMANIVSISTSGGLFAKLGIGNCSAGQIDMQIIPNGDIPRQAKIQVFVRLVNETQQSEWLPKGEYFFATRKMNRRTGVLTVHGYDAMLKAEEIWLNASYDTETWPMPAATAVADICKRIGVELDGRSILNSAFPVSYPVDAEGDLTMREVLGRLAVANAGNWIISDAGKLFLVPLNAGAAVDTDLALSVEQLLPGMVSKPISKVILLDDDGAVLAEAGTDTGRVLEAVHPDAANPEVNSAAAQPMANSILANIQGFIYRPFTAEKGLLDPAAELGDVVVIDGVNYVLTVSAIRFDKLCPVKLSTPGVDEVDDEYPYKSAIKREIQRNKRKTYSIISKTNEEIMMAVKNELTGQSAKIKIELGKISNTITGVDGRVSTLSQTVGGFDARIQDAEGNAATAIATANSFETRVSNAETGLSQTLRIAADGVTITNAGGSKLTIDGGQLKANSITADKIVADAIRVSTVWGTDTKVAIAAESNTVHIGGRSSNETFDNVYVHGKTITLNSWSSTSGIVINNSSPYAIYPNGVGAYSVGTSSYPFLHGYFQLGVTISDTSIGTMKIDGSSISSNKTTGSSCGTSTNPFYWGYFKTLVLDGRSIEHNKISYSASDYAYMNSVKQFIPASSTGYYCGNASYPWQYGYFTNLYVNGVAITGGTPAINKLTSGSYSVSLSSNTLAAASSTYSLGSSSYYWSKAYITTLYLSSNCYITAGSSNSIKVGTTTIGPPTTPTVSSLKYSSYSAGLNSSGALVPGRDSYQSLGNSSYYWYYLYVNRIYLKYSYTSLYLTCNSSGKLCVNGTAIH